MNKNKWILLIIILIILVISIALFFRKNNQSENNENYEASKTSQSENINTEQNITSSESTSNSETSNTSQPENTDITSVTKGITAPEPVEELVSTFSTKIYSKDEARQNNIYITCEALNDKIIENGATFSFCDTVGPSTTSKGYQKADIFDNNGKKKKGLGGRKLSNKYNII